MTPKIFSLLQLNLFSLPLSVSVREFDKEKILWLMMHLTGAPDIGDYHLWAFKFNAFRWNSSFLTHSSWSAFRIAGILVADGGLGLINELTETKLQGKQDKIIQYTIKFKI